ncbi:hypothetical protein P7H16_23440 [Paenibacillus larvae]|nr:hypothetical protein [Paenibacillus larvae]MDT2249271.1 hypothetical protein [Paenibacillus larvae]
MWYVTILLIALGTLIYALYYNIRNYRVFIKVMTESERRGREGMKRRKRLYDR